MKEIALNLGYTALVSDRDYNRTVQFNWFAKEDPKKSTVYAHRNLKKNNGKWTNQTLHRFILGITNPKVEVDHKGRNGLNCQRRNLRKATHGQNRANSCRSKNNKSGFKGVYWEKDTRLVNGGYWTAKLNKHRLGRYDTALKAAKAYDKAVKTIYGEFSVTNKSLGVYAWS